MVYLYIGPDRERSGKIGSLHVVYLLGLLVEAVASKSQCSPTELVYVRKEAQSLHRESHMCT
jgi:hypothetical protein